MDEMDRRLLSALRHDARASLSQLAGVLGWSRATVRNRLTRLKESGEIIGFSVVLKTDGMRDAVRALMMIAIEGRGTERILRHLVAMPEARAVHTTNGRWDVVVEIGAETLEALDEVLFRVRRLEGITASETSLLLSSRKSG